MPSSATAAPAAESTGPGIAADVFARLLVPLGPFEPNPTIAVAVSGGPDSMALTLLLAEWAHARNGRVEAVTVDHGLRPASAAEAEQVGRWLKDRPAIRHHVLRWSGVKPASAVQAAAREARYALMTEFCRREGILHLCLAHHLDDQMETQRMRAEHGSGAYGQAGMNAIRGSNGVRLLRPLLGMPKAALRETLERRGQAWIDDPSNRNPVFERVRLREILREMMSNDGAAHQRAHLHRLGLARAALDRDAAAVLATSLAVHPLGWAELDAQALGPSMPAQLHAFASILRAVGGGDYPVSQARLAEAVQALGEDGADFTLGGCHVQRKGAVLRLSRDWGAIREAMPASAGAIAHWDRRFEVQIDAEVGEGLTVARLGEPGIRWLGRHGHPLRPRETGVEAPDSARKALPALWRGETLVAVPHLGFGTGMNARFRPIQAATSSGFTVAY